MATWNLVNADDPLLARTAISAANKNISVNVTDYGADPTGVADSTFAIQAAINAAATPQSRVHIPAGNYRITSRLTLVSNVWIYGDGDGTYLDFSSPADSNDHLFYWSGTNLDDVTISDMRMRGNGLDLGDRSAQGAAVLISGTGAVSRPKVLRCRIERFRFGVNIYSATLVTKL